MNKAVARNYKYIYEGLKREEKGKAYRNQFNEKRRNASMILESEINSLQNQKNILKKELNKLMGEHKDLLNEQQNLRFFLTQMLQKVKSQSLTGSPSSLDDPCSNVLESHKSMMEVSSY